MGCSILVSAADDWAFGGLARTLAGHFGCTVSDRESTCNYVLSEPLSPTVHSYIPLSSIAIAADKRLGEAVFATHGVPRPETFLIPDEAGVNTLLRADPAAEYLLKYPTSCGANGHYLIAPGFVAKRNWPRPFLVQRFIRMERPRVYRAYCVAGQVVGSNVRRFADGVTADLIAHALGARYHFDEVVDGEGCRIALLAARAGGFQDSFCVVDLLRDREGRWLVLELGTDGIFNLVDRDFADESFSRLLHGELAASFNAWCARSSQGRIDAI